MTCTDTIRRPGNGALASALARASDGDVICLGPGEYSPHNLPLPIRASITLRGLEGAATTILAGTSSGPVLGLGKRGLTVRLEGLTLSGGSGLEGGALMVLKPPERLDIVDCVLENNRATRGGGGALWLDDGLLVMDRTRVSGNEGAKGGGIFLDRTARARLTDVVISHNRATKAGGGVVVWDGVLFECSGCVIEDNTCVDGSRGTQIAILKTAARAPTVRLTGGRVLGRHNGEAAIFNSGLLETEGTQLSSPDPGAQDE